MTPTVNAALQETRLRAMIYVFAKIVLEEFATKFFVVNEEDIPDYFLVNITDFIEDADFQMDICVYTEAVSNFFSSIDIEPTPNEVEINNMIEECSTTRRDQVVNSIVNKFDEFPEEWHDAFDLI